jgi:peptidoglycan/LPS O-acetylase OafA/YrhL
MRKVQERAVHSAVTDNERLHALDSLRAVAMLLGIVLHAAIPFMMFHALWIVHDANPSIAFDTLIGIIHGFRMQLFFFIAGFFAHLTWKRLDTRGFIRQRMLRIGLPFLAGMITIVPIGLWLYSWAETRNGPNPDLPRPLEPSLLLYPTMHLWFLELLLIFYGAAMLLALCRNFALMAKCSFCLDAAFDWLIRQPLKPLILCLPTIICLWNGPIYGEVDLMGMQLLPSLRAVIYFALFFSVGWWMHRRLRLLNELPRYLKTYSVLALLAFFAWGTGLEIRAVLGDSTSAYVKLFSLFGASLYAWSMTFAVTGLFLRFASGHHPWMRYLADASYWVYLWHIPIVLWLQLEVVKLPLGGWLKLLLILGATLAVLLLSYHFFVRYTWVGRILNGQRRPVTVAVSAEKMPGT